jgi:hypothetical protein
MQNVARVARTMVMPSFAGWYGDGHFGLAVVSHGICFDRRDSGDWGEEAAGMVHHSVTSPPLRITRMGDCAGSARLPLQVAATHHS